MHTHDATSAACPSCQRPAPRARQQGFTLIEVLIAIALMALVSLMSWKGLERVSAAREWLGDQAVDQAIVLRTLGQIERDLNRAYSGVPAGYTTTDSSDASGGTSGGSTVSTAGTAGNADDDDSTLFPPGINVTQSAGAVVLDITRATPDSGLWQRVTWRLRPDGLWRYSGTPAANYPLPEPTEGILIMPDSTGLQVRAWVFGQGWRDPLRPATTRASGLEIAIERRHSSQLERYTRVVILP